MGGVVFGSGFLASHIGIKQIYSVMIYIHIKSLTFYSYKNLNPRNLQMMDPNPYRVRKKKSGKSIFLPLMLYVQEALTHFI